jgi:hypothetical protein
LEKRQADFRGSLLFGDILIKRLKMENIRILTAIGYWHSFNEPSLPDPGSFVDDAWNSEERDKIVAYLRAAHQMPYAFAGVSWCRFRCGISDLGSTEYTDGKYLWPVGLVHYVEKHNVKLPREVIDFMLNHKEREELEAVCDNSTVDLTWWLNQRGENTANKTFNDRLDIGILTIARVHDKRKHKQEEAIRLYLLDAIGMKRSLVATEKVLSGQELQLKGSFQNVNDFIAKLPALGLRGMFQYLTKEEYGIE